MQLAWLRWVGFVVVVVVVVNNNKHNNYDSCNTIPVEKNGRSWVVPLPWQHRKMHVPSPTDRGCINIVATGRCIVLVDVINPSSCVNPMAPRPVLFLVHPDPSPHPYHPYHP